jgi:hypothetical protein
LGGFAKDFLGNHKAAICQDVVQDLLTSHKAVGNFNKGGRHKKIFPKLSAEIKDENTLNPKTNSGVIGSWHKPELTYTDSN